MIVWLNGAFGAGKTTTARLLAERMPDAHLFDSEEVGYLLRTVLAGPRPVEDFQEWKAWRSLVVAAADAVLGELGGTLVIPQSVYVQHYWTELLDGFAARDIEVRPFVLDVEPVELERRIRGAVETAAVDWRLSKAAANRAALEWLPATSEVIDTTSLAPVEVVERILSSTAR